MSSTARSLQIAKYAHEVLVKAISDFPPERATFQTSPTDNHLLWHLGHLALDYNWFAAALDGKPVGATESDNKLFGMGSKPLPDANAYPAAAELRTKLDAAWQRFSAAAGALRDEDAAKPPLMESGGFLKDRLDVIDKSTWHDGWHTGQLSGLRKALGLKGLFGT